MGFFDEQSSWEKYRHHINENRPVAAIETALGVLRDRRAENPSDYEVDHKGVPFYSLGFCAFASHDYTSASLYFDAAVSEDLKNFPRDFSKPSVRFLLLQSELSERTLSSTIVDIISGELKAAILVYNGKSGSNFITFEDFQRRFLQVILGDPSAENRTLVTALLSFVAEHKYRMIQISLLREGSREPFFLHLFRGCVLFESILKYAVAKSSPGISVPPTLGGLLHSQAAALGLTQIQTASNSFEDVLRNLTTNMDIEKSINCCAQTRNTLGHNISWSCPSLSEGNYDKIYNNILSSILHVISRCF